MLRVGIDVGGTFTDLFAYDDDTGVTATAKVPTTIANQAIGVLASIRTAAISLADVGFIGHGTTTGLNALLERRGAVTGLITTNGFRDVLEIMRTDRESGYDLGWSKPVPFVPRRLRAEVEERVLHDGTVATPLNEETVRSAVRHLRDAGVQSFAISLLHAYANPTHERRIAEIVEEEAPGTPTSLSSEINAEIREFERTNTVVVDAYIKPVMVRYIRRLVDELGEDGFDGRLLLMQGSGGMMTADRACDKPIMTLSSGPAAGAIAAARIAAMSGLGDIVTFDVGGTSTDVSLIRDGRPFVNTEKLVGWGLPARVPMIDVASVGAGGGSIGWIDQGGALKMGPRSAGSQPGPICYGGGGKEPTLSDALLLKGVLGKEIADGALRLDGEEAFQEIRRRIAEPLGLSVERVIEGMIEIAQSNMANAVRSVSTWKGIDPRDLTLVAFGGAGGLVAVEVARMLGIPKVLVPPVPGNACAMGTLMTSFQDDRAVAYLARVDAADPAIINERLGTLRQQTIDALVAQGVDEADVSLADVVDMRYHGQIHELQIPLDAFPVTYDSIETAIAAFEETYERVYSIRVEGGVAEFVSLRVTAIGTLPHYQVPLYPGSKEEAVPKSRRDVIEDGRRQEVDVYGRYSLPVGTELLGPVIIEEAGSTTWVAPRMTCGVDDHGNLVINTATEVRVATELRAAVTERS